MHQKHPPAKVATSSPASGGESISWADALSVCLAPKPRGRETRRAPRRDARREVLRASPVDSEGRAWAWTATRPSLVRPALPPNAREPVIVVIVVIDLLLAPRDRADLLCRFDLDAIKFWPHTSSWLVGEETNSRGRSPGE